MKRTNGRGENTNPAEQTEKETAQIPFECPKEMKLAIKARAASLDLSVNQYLRQLARRDLEATA